MYWRSATCCYMCCESCVSDEMRAPPTKQVVTRERLMRCGLAGTCINDCAHSE